METVIASWTLGQAPNRYAVAENSDRLMQIVLLQVANANTNTTSVTTSH